MPNFLEETKVSIQRSGKTIEDIIFIGDLRNNTKCTWAEFEKMADFEYDNGFGSLEINEELIIVFKDNTIFSRREYDGSEWWEYAPPFVMPENTTKLTSVKEEY